MLTSVVCRITSPKFPRPYRTEAGATASACLVSVRDDAVARCLMRIRRYVHNAVECRFADQGHREARPLYFLSIFTPFFVHYFLHDGAGYTRLFFFSRDWRFRRGLRIWLVLTRLFYLMDRHDGHFCVCESGRFLLIDPARFVGPRVPRCAMIEFPRTFGVSSASMHARRATSRGVETWDSFPGWFDSKDTSYM